MTRKELKVIWNALDNAQNAIGGLCTEDYPYTDFNDPDFRKMFYTLNAMCITVHRKMDALDNP